MGTPIVQLVVVTEEDFDNTEGSRLRGKVRQEVLASSTRAQDVKYEHPDNTIMVEVGPSIRFSEASIIRGLLRQVMEQEEYTVADEGIRADTQQSGL